MPSHLTVFYTQTAARVGGWSENFWSTTSDSNITGNLVNRCNALIAGSLAAKGNQTSLLGYRISLYDNVGRPTGVSRIFSEDAVDRVNTLSLGSGTDSDYATIALLLEARNSNGQETRQWFHGVPDKAVKEGGIYRPDSTVAARMNAFIALLDNNQWGIRCRNRDTSAPKPIEIAIKTDGIWSFLTFQPHGLTNGQEVKTGRIDSYQAAMSPNGTWKVSVTNDTTFRLVGFNPGSNALINVKKSSYVRAMTYQFLAGSWYILRATSRQVGRPFGSPSGRVRRTK